MDPQEPVNSTPTQTENPITNEVSKKARGVSSINNINTITIASMAIFVLLSLGAVAFLYYQNQQLKGMLASYQTPVASPTAIATSDPIANWKTYTDKSDGFSFKYPPNWNTFIVDESPSPILMVAPKEKVDEVKQIQGGFEGGSFLILTMTTNSKPPVWKTNENWQVASESIKIDGRDGTKYNIELIQGVPGFNQGDKITSMVIKNDGSYNQINLLDHTYTEIYNQILSTFKFLEVPIATPISTLKPKTTPILY